MNLYQYLLHPLQRQLSTNLLLEDALRRRAELQSANDLEPTALLEPQLLQTTADLVDLLMTRSICSWSHRLHDNDVDA